MNIKIYTTVHYTKDEPHTATIDLPTGITVHVSLFRQIPSIANAPCSAANLLFLRRLKRMTVCGISKHSHPRRLKAE